MHILGHRSSNCDVIMEDGFWSGKRRDVLSLSTAPALCIGRGQVD